MEIELRQVVRAAIRWGWLIALTTVLTGALAFALTKGQTATYSATTTLLVNPQVVTSATDNSALQASRSQADTYVRLVASGPVLDRVREDLGLELTRNQLAEKIDASTVMNTQLVQITVKDPSPEEAARIANAVATSLQSRVDELTVGRLQENLEQAKSESTALRSRINEIDAELADLDTDANRDDAEAQRQVATLQEERMRAQETIADLDASIRSLNQQLATTTSPVEVADEAQAARRPVSPKPLLVTALGLFLGFLVGCGLAALLEATDRRVRPETDIEDLTGERLLAVVPVDRKVVERAKPVLDASPDSPTAESIRLLRTHLQSFVDAHPHGILSLAYAAAGPEGSVLLANLGLAFAQSGVSTIEVDANLREPSLHDSFGMRNAGGLASLVGGGSGEGSLIDVAPGLRLLNAGAATEHPASIVGSAAFARVLEELRDEADVLLVNTSPALAYSDAVRVASIVDGVLVVGRYGETNRDDLATLVSTIREDGMTLAGIVMIGR